MLRLCTILFSLLLWTLPASAGPGHDHGDESSGAMPAEPVPRLESAGTELELVAIAEGHRLTIHLDRYDTNEPVDGATIEVSGEGIPAQIAEPVGEGAYAIEAEWVDEPGTKALTFLITSGDIVDLLNGTLEIPEPATGPEPVAIPVTTLLTRPEIWILAALAMLFGFVLSFAFRPMRLPEEEAETSSPQSGSQPRLNVVEAKRQIAQVIVAAAAFSALVSANAFAGPGHDHGEHGHGPQAAGGNVPQKLPEGEVFLPKPSQRLLGIRTVVASESTARLGKELVGTVIPDPSSEGRIQAPMDGVIELSGAAVSFVGQLVQAGDVLAELAPAMPVYERGALEQMAADVEGKLRIAEARLARLTSVGQGYIAQREIEDTQTEVESLKAQKRVLEPKQAQKLRLTAPVSGIISVANVRPGQVVSARDTLFEIVDPSRLWIEAIGAGGLDDYSSIAAAEAVDGRGHPVALSYVGQAPTLRQHSRPLFFRIDSRDAALAVGATVKVVLQQDGSTEGVVLPEAAVVRGLNGLPQVWVKTGAERFKPMPVRAVALDGSQLLVTAGLNAGDRVVTAGSQLINQIR